MAFHENEIRFERFSAEMTYHSAYNYLSLKGVLAERWGHGPLFGAFADAGGQVTLTPAQADEPNPPAKVQGFYGLKASGFLAEQTARGDVTEMLRNAIAWHRDVAAVLTPRRTVQLVVNWFLLHPISNAERSSRLLRERYYSPANVSRLKPERYGSYHSAVENIVTQGDESYSVVLGVVGPPHKNTFFTYPDPARDGHWWMGLRTSFTLKQEDGIADPVDRMEEMISQSRTDVISLARTGFAGIID